MKSAKMETLIVKKESVLTAIIKSEMSAKCVNVMIKGQRKTLFVTKILVTAQTTARMAMRARSAKIVKAATIDMEISVTYAFINVMELLLMLAKRANVMIMAIVFVSQTLLAMNVISARQVFSKKK